MSKKKKQTEIQDEVIIEDGDQPEEKSDILNSLEEDSPEIILDLSSEEIAELQSSLAQNEAKSAEYLDGWQRSRAELTNYRKRVERDRIQNRKNIAGDILRRYLPVVDDLERALNDRPGDENGALWAEGVELIYRKMLNVLESEGVTTMNPEGETFNPNFHEAIMQTESDEYECDQIVEVLQRGYMIGERVLRPAVVKIAA
ncbi:MAG: nucleotide exchange factor GrpE [Chloroflexi bacterium]|nr:nucleotide exchange factor GrpE [Chloroflexota bacterium]